MKKRTLDQILEYAWGLLRLQTDMARGGYARCPSGKPRGIHCKHATRHDLAGLIFLACEHSDSHQRDGLFLDAWNRVRQYLERPRDEQNPAFCRWLDQHSYAWHVSLLEGMLGIKKPQRPQTSNKHDITEYV